MRVRLRGKMKRPEIPSDKPCQPLIIENIMNVKTGKPLTAPLAYLNQFCEFRRVFERTLGSIRGTRVTDRNKEEQKAIFKEYMKVIQKEDWYKEYQSKYQKEKYKNDKEYVKKLKAYQKEYHRRKKGEKGKK